MSLIARRLLSNNMLRRSAGSVRFLTSKSIKLNTATTISQPQFQISKQFYSTENVELKTKFDNLVKDKKIVLFMKGTPDKPMCGFSKAVVNILQFHGAPFESLNVLADESIRSGIKEYTDWPTIPQIFFNGEFIGGCDILMEMHKSGDIVEELEKIGITSKAPQK